MSEGPRVQRPGPEAISHLVVRQSALSSVAAAAAVVSGLLLDVAIAARYGAGPATDALFVAARLPLGVVAIVMVGANQALVPAITTSLERRGAEPTWRLVSTLLTGATLLGFALVGLVGMAAEPLMRLTAPGLAPERVEQAAGLARVLFLVVPLVGAAEVLRALLNARYSFVAPAAMHAVMNVVAGALVLSIVDGVGVVAWAYVAGAAAQVVFMLVMAVARGLRPRPSFAFRDPDVAAAARLSVKPLLGAGLNPLARVGEQLFVSFLPAGSITILNYGYRLISAIGGSVLFRSVVVALLPRLTSAVARGRSDEALRIARLGVRIMLYVSVPLTPLMAVLATPAAIAMFDRGNFSRDDAVLLGLVLAVYSGSLVGSAIQRGLLAPFFARLDTRVPFRNTAYGIAANLALVPLCIIPFGRTEYAIVGVAIAYSLAQYVNVAHAWVQLRAIGVSLDHVWSTIWRLGVAAVVGGALLVSLDAWLDLGAPEDRWSIVAKTAAAAVTSSAVMAGVLVLIAGNDMRRLRTTLRRDGRASGPRDVIDPGGPTEDPG
jgi:putative peptidoglycan lipid II flippase